MRRRSNTLRAKGIGIMKLFLAALLGALAMFAWEFVAHMFTPLGEAGIWFMPKTEAVSSSLTSAIGDKAGMYMFPTGGCDRRVVERGEDESDGEDDGRDENESFWPAHLQAGGNRVQFWQVPRRPVRHRLRQGPPRRVVADADRVGRIWEPGWICRCCRHYRRDHDDHPHWNWYGFDSTFTMANVVMDVVGFLVAGLVIAAILKPARSGLES